VTRPLWRQYAIALSLTVSFGVAVVDVVGTIEALDEGSDTRRGSVDREYQPEGEQGSVTAAEDALQLRPDDRGGVRGQ